MIINMRYFAILAVRQNCYCHDVRVKFIYTHKNPVADRDNRGR
jgi:hypothetical protein